VPLAGLELDHARKVHRHDGGDVGDAEAAGGDEVLAPEALVEHDEKLLDAGQAALRELGARGKEDARTAAR